MNEKTITKDIDIKLSLEYSKDLWKFPCNSLENIHQTRNHSWGAFLHSGKSQSSQISPKDDVVGAMIKNQMGFSYPSLLFSWMPRNFHQVACELLSEPLTTSSWRDPRGLGWYLSFWKFTLLGYTVIYWTAKMAWIIGSFPLSTCTWICSFHFFRDPQTNIEFSISCATPIVFFVPWI